MCYIIWTLKFTVYRFQIDGKLMVNKYILWKKFEINSIFLFNHKTFKTYGIRRRCYWYIIYLLENWETFKTCMSVFPKASVWQLSEDIEGDFCQSLKLANKKYLSNKYVKLDFLKILSRDFLNPHNIQKWS